MRTTCGTPLHLRQIPSDAFFQKITLPADSRFIPTNSPSPGFGEHFGLPSADDQRADDDYFVPAAYDFLEFSDAVELQISRNYEARFFDLQH